MPVISTYVACSVLCLFVCIFVGHTGGLRKTAELIEIPFGGHTHVGQKNGVPVLDVVSSVEVTTL